jgi:hypothetical protein
MPRLLSVQREQHDRMAALPLDNVNGINLDV